MGHAPEVVPMQRWFVWWSSWDGPRDVDFATEAEALEYVRSVFAQAERNPNRADGWENGFTPPHVVRGVELPLIERRTVTEWVFGEPKGVSG